VDARRQGLGCEAELNALYFAPTSLVDALPLDFLALAAAAGYEYFPLASGLLSGKYKRGAPIAKGLRFDLMPQFRDRFLTDANFTTVEALEAFARQRGRTLVELAFGWLAGRPTVASVIAGASTPEQVAQNAAAVGCTLGADDLAELDRIAEGSSR